MICVCCQRNFRRHSSCRPLCRPSCPPQPVRPPEFEHAEPNNYCAFCNSYLLRNNADDDPNYLAGCLFFSHVNLNGNDPLTFSLSVFFLLLLLLLSNLSESQLFFVCLCVCVFPSCFCTPEELKNHFGRCDCVQSKWLAVVITLGQQVQARLVCGCQSLRFRSRQAIDTGEDD